MAEAVTAHKIAITRVFDAPRELVWKAWTDPAQLAAWWGKRGWNALPSTITVSEADGTEMPQEGVYREVVAPERLVIEEASEGAWHDGAVSIVTFTDLGDGRTAMDFRTTVHTTDEMRGHAEAGMASSIERLAEHLA